MEITKMQLNKMLDKHSLWLKNHNDGERFDANKIDLSFANLSSADLRDARLEYANFNFAKLNGADLSGARLYKADFSDASLRGTKMIHCQMTRTNFSDANLRNANLTLSCMDNAVFSHADMRKAKLRKTNVCGANFAGANMFGTDIRDIEYDAYTAFLRLQCPFEGEFIGWKSADDCILKLLIPEDAKRSSSASRDCRCSKAKLLGIFNCRIEPLNLTSVRSDGDIDFIYEVGKTIEVPDFNMDRWSEEAAGIHFYMLQEEAVDHLKSCMR